MGLYDTVKVLCPKCGEPYYAQSKGGPCELANYTLADAPADVLSDVNRHAPFTCGKCGNVWEVTAEMAAAIRVPDPRDAEIASLKALVAKLAAVVRAVDESACDVCDSGDEDHENECHECGNPMDTRDGCEPSRECDLCAQTVLATARSHLAALAPEDRAAAGLGDA